MMDGSMPPVALESTLVAQGLPWPANLETALASEGAVRSEGAEPRTIAILGGEVRAGLSGEELERVARGGSTFAKAGRRDLGFARARRLDAATTVSGTLFLARRSGIRVMGTGGLGGVHRDWTARPDISADLLELADADGCLVACSGFKSILDMPASLEALEALGVAVVGYRTDELPAFLSPRSGLMLDARVDTPEEAAAVVASHRELGIPGAVVLVQPPPPDVALDPDEMDRALAVALEEARRAGVVGKALSPFLLGRLRAATGDRALAANRALIVENARLAAAVAVCLAKLPG